MLNGRIEDGAAKGPRDFRSRYFPFIHNRSSKMVSFSLAFRFSRQKTASTPRGPHASAAEQRAWRHPLKLKTMTRTCSQSHEGIPCLVTVP